MGGYGLFTSLVPLTRGYFVTDVMFLFLKQQQRLKCPLVDDGYDDGARLSCTVSQSVSQSVSPSIEARYIYITSHQIDTADGINQIFQGTQAITSSSQRP
jgi:hypothetical protein